MVACMWSMQQQPQRCMHWAPRRLLSGRSGLVMAGWSAAVMMVQPYALTWLDDHHCVSCLRYCCLMLMCCSSFAEPAHCPMFPVWQDGSMKDLTTFKMLCLLDKEALVSSCFHEVRALSDPQIPSSIPGGTHSDSFRMFSPTANYFPVRSNLQKFTAKSRISQYWLPVDYKSTDRFLAWWPQGRALQWVEGNKICRWSCIQSL